MWREAKGKNLVFDNLESKRTTPHPPNQSPTVNGSEEGILQGPAHQRIQQHHEDKVSGNGADWSLQAHRTTNEASSKTKLCNEEKLLDEILGTGTHKNVQINIREEANLRTYEARFFFNHYVNADKKEALL